MELTLGDDSDGNSGGGDPTDMVQNIERALENPRVRGMVSAVLEQQGLDPSQFGLADQNDATAVEPAENPVPNETQPEPDVSADGGAAGIGVQDLVTMIDVIAQQSPVGYKTTIGQVKEHIEENPDEIENALAENGLQ